MQEAIPCHLVGVIIVSQTQNDFFLPPLRIRITPNVKDRIQFPRDLEGRPRLGGIYLGAVQGPERTYCHIYRTTLPHRLHIICYHRHHCHIIRTLFLILIFPDPPLRWNACIHQNPPPRHGTVLRIKVWVHTVSLLPHKYTCNHLSLCLNPPLLLNPSCLTLPWGNAGASSRVRSGAVKNGIFRGGLIVEGNGSVGSVVAIIVFHIVGF